MSRRLDAFRFTPTACPHVAYACRLLGRLRILLLVFWCVRYRGTRAIDDEHRATVPHGVAATVVFSEYLTEKTPDGRDRVEHSVPILNAMFVENVPDAGLSQDVHERVEAWRRRKLAQVLSGAPGFPIWIEPETAPGMTRSLP